jgi:type I restriction enzyme, S subunit
VNSVNKVAELLTQNLDIWTSAIERRSTAGRGRSKKFSLYGIEKLRSLILDLAICGKLASQSRTDEPVSELLKRIGNEKTRLLNLGTAKKQKVIAPNSSPPFRIPDNWKWSQIAEIGLLNPRNEVSEDVDASFVPMPMIAAEYGTLNEHEVRPWKEIKSGYTHFFEGDVGLAKITPCFENGKSTAFRNLTGGFGSGTTELHIVRPLFVEAIYILIFLKSRFFIESGIPKMTGTAGQKRVPLDYFAYSPFPLPPLAEQHRIVAKVDELMALCDRLEAGAYDAIAAHQLLVKELLSTLTESKNAADFAESWKRIETHFDTLFTTEESINHLKQTILQLAVMGKLVPQDANEEPTSELLRQVRSENQQLILAKNIRVTKPALPVEALEYQHNIPPSWQHVYLQDIAYQITDGTHLTPKYTESGKPFLSAQNIKPFQFKPDVHRYVSEHDYENYRANRKPELGDILLTRVGAGIGEAAVLNTEFEFAFYVSLCLIKIPTNSISNEYLTVWLNSPEGRHSSYSRTYGQGASQGNLNLSMIRTFKIPLPPIAEQRRIVAKVHELVSLCNLLLVQSCKAQDQQLQFADAVASRAVA